MNHQATVINGLEGEVSISYADLNINFAFVAGVRQGTLCLKSKKRGVCAVVGRVYLSDHYSFSGAGWLAAVRRYSEGLTLNCFLKHSVK